MDAGEDYVLVTFKQLIQDSISQDSSSISVFLSYSFSELFRGTVGTVGLRQERWEPDEESLWKHNCMCVLIASGHTRSRHHTVAFVLLVSARLAHINFPQLGLNSPLAFICLHESVPFTSTFHLSSKYAAEKTRFTHRNIYAEIRNGSVHDAIVLF